MPRAKLRTAELRATVVETALELLESEGVDALTTRRVAASSGTSPPAIYEFFGDKKGLLSAVFFEGFRMLSEALGRLDVSPDPRADVMAVMWSFRRFALAHPALSELMFSRPVAEFDPNPHEREASGGVRRAIVGRVKRCVESGELHGAPNDIAHSLLALMMGLAAQERGGWLGSTPSVAAGRWRRGITALLDGFAVLPAPLDSPVDIRRASTRTVETKAAVDELREVFGSNPTGVICFCSPQYDLMKLGPSLEEAFPTATIIGCTTSGQIGATGFQPDGMAATSFSGPFHVRSYEIDLSEVAESVAAIAQPIRQFMAAMSPDENAFGFLLVDGLCELEEHLSAELHETFPNLPVVGGSAGDDLRFEETRVLVDGAFRSGIAALMVIRTTAAFAPLKVVHHIPTDRTVTVTAADPTKRCVMEFDGRPAAEAYAANLSLAAGDLDRSTFAEHPLILREGGESLIRSVHRVDADGSMFFYAGIEPGTVLAIAKSAEVMESLRNAFDKAKAVVQEPQVVLGCDCVIRRLQLEELGMDQEVGEFFARQAVVGFSTYGEQLEGAHLNQTFAGIVIGDKPEA